MSACRSSSAPGGVEKHRRVLTELEDYCTDLLILSRGKLVEQRRLGSGGGRSLIAIELVEPFAGLEAMLAGEGVEMVSLAPAKALLRMAADPAAQAALLQRLVAAGAPVSRFGPDQENIQELYKARVKP
jgi:ABC-2 type transport system ATP-binding protein